MPIHRNACPVLLGILWKGVLLGLGAAAPIGPVNVEIARRSLRGGFAAGCALGLGAVTIDVLYAVLASLSIRLVIDNPMVMTALGLLGAGLLLYLAGQCILSFRSQLRPAGRGFPLDSPTGNIDQNEDIVSPTPPPQTHHYLTGVLMTGVNPMTLVFWFVVVPGVVGQISEDPSRELPFICVGVFIGALCWVVFFSSLMSAAGRINRRIVLLIADGVGGLLLFAFAGVAIWRVVRPLL